MEKVCLFSSSNFPVVRKDLYRKQKDDGHQETRNNIETISKILSRVSCIVFLIIMEDKVITVRRDAWLYYLLHHLNISSDSIRVSTSYSL